MDQPYVLAKVHKAGADSKGRRIYAGTTSVGPSKISSREVVTAVDSQGLSVYNLQSNQLANSYSLSPSTKFHCAPISVLDRLSSKRQTYAALQTGTDNLRIERWHESGAVEETQTASFNILEEVHTLKFINDKLIIIYTSGTIEIVSSDLSTSLETIKAATYTGQESVAILATRLYPSVKETDSLEISILTHNHVTSMYNLRINFLENTTECEVLTSQLHIEIASRQGSRSDSMYAVFGDDGQFLITEPESQELVLNVFDKAGTRTKSFRIAKPDGAVLDRTSIRWLNSSQVLISIGAVHSIWDLIYEIQLDSMTTNTDTDVLTVVPQKSPVPSSTVVAQLVLCNANQISVSRISYSRQSNLFNVIEKRATANSAPLWVQDVDIQSTWKDSLSMVTASARRCLNEVAASRDGFEIDSIMAEFLFPGQKINFLQVGPSKQVKQNGVPKPNGHAVNGVAYKDHAAEVADSDSEDSGLAESLIKESPTSVEETHQRFATYDTDISLSMPFVSRTIHLIFEKFSANDSRFVLPSATLDFLLKKGLVALTGPHDEMIVKNLSKVPVDLCLRFITDTPGLLPEQLFIILESALEAPHLKVILGAIIHKLDQFDDNLVVLAIRAQIPAKHIYNLLKIFSDELQHRIADSEYKNELQVSDHALCSAVTTFLDAIGVSNLIFTTAGAQLLSSLRSSVSHMVAQSDHIGSTAHCISELLMKARIADKIKVISAEERALESNPEPQQKKASMPLDKVKKQLKNLSARAKAHAIVQGIGSVYTIETLQI